jgi:hypothetical protein
MGPFAVDIIKMPTELREAQIDQAGKPTLGIGQFRGLRSKSFVGGGSSPFHSEK